MRALLLSTVAFAALAGSALAADLPSTKGAPVYVAPEPAFSWTGFYIGADIGGAFPSTQWTDLGTGATHTLDDSGVMGGGYIGYNYQLNPNIVLGVEGDFQGTSASGSYSLSQTIPYNVRAGFYTNTYTAKSSLDWLAAINGRLGVSYERALFYAIGGAAWAGESDTLSLTNSVLGYVGSASNSKTLSGYDIGAGVDYAFTPNWVGRVEYRYYDFGNTTWYPTVSSFGVRDRTDVNTIRVGLSYLFSSPAPVVAKY